MSVYKRGDVWWYRFQVRGREHRGSTRTGDRRAAQVEERRVRAITEAGAPDSRPAGAIDVAQLAEWDAARALAEGVAESRAKTLEWIWTPLADHFGARPVQGIDHQALVGYVAKRRAGGVRGQTIRREVQALKRGLEIAKGRGLILTVPPSPRIRSDAPSDAQRGRLHPPEMLAAWVGALHQDARDEVELALRTGLRAAELKRIAPSWVEPAPAGAETRYVLRVPAASAKGRRERVIGLTDAAAAIVLRRIEANPEATTVLSQSSHRRAYRTASAAIGYGTRIKLRDLRHTFATLAVAGSGDPWAALESLGHRDLRTTSRYQHTTELRASATAAAAERLLEVGTAGSAQRVKTGALDGELSNDIEVLNGGRGGFRTHDPRLVRPTQAHIDHACACDHCSAQAAIVLEMLARACPCRHTQSAQPEAEVVVLGEVRGVR